jgi:ferric-dicitrate binding protein FerR (iron transport regulator)
VFLYEKVSKVLERFQFMAMVRSLLFLLAFALVIGCFAGGPATAQTACSWSLLSDPVRQVIRCGDAVTLEREAGTQVTIFERAGDAPPRAIELENGAIFINVAPGSAPTQIRTPHAIAAVRGTTYVVDASTASTSVFVLEGRVQVRKTNDASTVTLGPGEGVDVAADTTLSVVSWGAARVAALLARFGR